MLTEAARQRLLALGAAVEAAWDSSGAPPATRQRIIRTLIAESVVRVEDDARDLVIRWAGGDHTAVRVRKNRAGQHRWGTDAGGVELVTVLARQLPDKAMALLLNRACKTTGRGNGWTRSRVCIVRNHRGLSLARYWRALGAPSTALAAYPGHTRGKGWRLGAASPAAANRVEEEDRAEVIEFA